MKTTSERAAGACARMIFDHAAASSGADAAAGLLLFAEPEAWIEAHDADDVAPALASVDAALAAGYHVAGFLAYELAFALEPSLHPLLPPPGRLPLLRFGLYRNARLLSAGEAASFRRDAARSPRPGGLTGLHPRVDRATYLTRFEQVRELILAGDVYQLNLAIPAALDWHGDPFSLYARLCERQPVRHGGYISFDEASILSFSPELFFALGGGLIRTRPMKGTIGRGASKEADAARRRALQGDEKNRAENLMIVDLMRNDLSRVCRPGSVRVSDLYRIETLPSLHQMTSGIEGRLAPGTGLSDILRALFPAGSITGAPKLKAIERIAALEARARGVYTGAIGHVRRAADGTLEGSFNVAIRTLTLWPGGTGEVCVGSGIVADSRGEAEYEECLLKYGFLMPPDFQLIETIALTPDGDLVLIERHLARLERSAAVLGFRCSLDEIAAALHGLAAEQQHGHHRLRLLLWPSGRFELTATAFEGPQPDLVVPVVVSDRRVASGDSLLRHKTTRRALYESEWTRWHELKGAGEVLFLNERGELAEGSRSNIFIERACELLTPPLDAGLLPGTLREDLIATGRARECRLTLDDLRGATAVYVGNSVRGLQRARLVG